LARRVTASLALDPAEVAAANRIVLARWDYPAAWQSLQEAAARVSGDLAW
ncbi:MAG: hypothetical protein QOJ16_4349, partial [Acidobacteriota bacterium]|nr:hypothetical protein [Acidobacteriota bacterium]